jgi:hypothetical protein
LAVSGPESLSFANTRKFLTSSLDHARTLRRFVVAIDASLLKKAHIIPARERNSGTFFLAAT